MFFISVRFSRLAPGHSMFYYKGGPRKCNAKRAKHYCTCKEFCCGRQPSRQINCDYTGYAQRPKYIQGMKGWKKLNFPGAEHCGKRKRRSTSSEIILPDDDSELEDYMYNPDPNLNVTAPIWPTNTGKTEIETRRHCEKVIKDSEPGKVCKSYIPDFDFEPFVEQCIEDVQVRLNKILSVLSYRPIDDKYDFVETSQQKRHDVFFEQFEQKSELRCFNKNYILQLVYD